MQLIGVRKVRDRKTARIPSEALDILDIKEGDLVEFALDNKTLLVRKYPQEAATA